MLSLYTCMHACTSVACIHMYTHVYICIHMYTHVYTCIHMYTHVYTCRHMYTHVQTCTDMYTHVYTCIHMYTHVYTCTQKNSCKMKHIKCKGNSIWGYITKWYSSFVVLLKRTVLCHLCNYLEALNVELVE